MPITIGQLQSLTLDSPADAWSRILDLLWSEFSPPIESADADAEVVRRDRNLTELDNTLSGAAWDLWTHFDNEVQKASQSLQEFWTGTYGGKAVLILDGLSLRETPWLLGQAKQRGFSIHQAGVRGAELPAETTPFANSLGFGQRSALENNGAGTAHRFTGAVTESCDLPWVECRSCIGAHQALVLWHHWPDSRVHDLSGPGSGLRLLARETCDRLTSDDFWCLVGELTNGRRLVITGDHGYAASGLFPDLTDKEQVSYMKSHFRSGRVTERQSDDGSWVPPIDIKLTSAHGTNRFVLGRRKWKSAGGYPTLTHGGLSLLEVMVPFFEISS